MIATGGTRAGEADASARSAGASAAPQGLSNVHNRPKSQTWDFRAYEDGSLCELKAPRLLSIAPRCSAKRGKVSGFSAASRRRMLKTVGKLKQNELPVFVTLTYPDEFPFDAKTWRKHLAALWRRVRRRWPGAAALWKKEFKRRQSGENTGKVAPHFHMLLWGAVINADDPYDWVKHWKMELAKCDIADGKDLIVTQYYLDGMQPEIMDLGPDVKIYQRTRKRKRGDLTIVQYWRRDGVPHLTNDTKRIAAKWRGEVVRNRDVAKELRAWFSVTWAEIVGSDDPRHLVAGTRVETVKSVRGVFAYASKYLAKREDDPAAEYESIGRCWGIMGREHLPWATVVELRLEREQAIRLRRAATRYLTAERRKRGGHGRYKCRSLGMFWFSSGPPAWTKVARLPIEPF